MDTQSKVKKGGKRCRKAIMRAAIVKRWSTTKATSPIPSSSTAGSSKQTDAEGISLSASREKLSLLKSPPHCPSSSSSELQLTTDTDTTSQPSHVWCLMELGKLNKVISAALCPKCLNNSLIVKKDINRNKGFTEPIFSVCQTNGCNYVSDKEFSSPTIKEETLRPFEINTLMTIYATEIGKGNAALQKLQMFLGLSTMTAKTFSVHQGRLQQATNASTTSLLTLAVEKAKEANCTELCEDGITNITVSFDGTWQKRGFSSKYGVGVAIEIQTGLVVYFEVLSTYCHACILAAKRYGVDSKAYADWKESHSECAKNFNGSSKAMEAEAARRIWMRSVEKFGVRYTHILSDGDSSTYPALTTLKPMGKLTPL